MGRRRLDTYVFSLDSGVNKIVDFSGKDMIRFTDGISPDMIKMTWIQGTDDILITFKNQIGSDIRLVDWYKKEKRIESFEFADGHCLEC